MELAIKNYSWEITHQKVHEAIHRIITKVSPHKIIIFGSYVAGTFSQNSDLDIMVIMKPPLLNARNESVKIRRLLKGIQMSIDVLVTTADRFEKIKDMEGLIYKEILKTGRVVYEGKAN